MRRTEPALARARHLKDTIRRIITMPAIERLLFAIGAIVIVMMAMTLTTLPRGKAGDALFARKPAQSDHPALGEGDERFIGMFSR